MSIDDQDLSNFKRKVSQYQEILANTEKYREKWKKELRNETLNFLEKAATEAGLSCSVEHRADITNLEAVVLSLGSSNSGPYTAQALYMAHTMPL